MLGPRPGSRKRTNKLNVSGLGRSLVNQQKNESKNKGLSDRYTTENAYGSGSNLKSVTEQQPLEELMATAELSGKDFTTERTASVRIVQQPAGSRTLLSKADRDNLIKQHYDNAGKLTVPRRPRWTREMSPLELDRLEKEAFLAWRRSLAELQENPEFGLEITPFERNLEVWRQLWRVLERSHLVVQIVDARNPLLYRSEDLDKYVNEFESKKTLLLINKADLLSEKQRETWAKYFKDNEIPYAFFSAKQASVDNEAKKQKDSQESQPSSSIHDNVGDIKILSNSSPISVLSVDQLEQLFIVSAPPTIASDQLQIGLVGYPNVGKSSTINALIGAKKVSVSSTPGKTKHFQTINLSKEMMLCDCPGLVFPNFAKTKAELVCQGVLPIDQLRDYMSPSALVAERIPKVFLERHYGIKLHTRPVTALDLLETYAKYRGYNRTGGGAPDSSRAARIILKDYVNAKLPFAMPPPDYKFDAENFNNDELNSQLSLQGSEEETNLSETISTTEQYDQADEELADELDRDFFTQGYSAGSTSVPFHLKGKQQVNTSKKHNKGKKRA